MNVTLKNSLKPRSCLLNLFLVTCGEATVFLKNKIKSVGQGIKSLLLSRSRLRRSNQKMHVMCR